MGFRFKTKTNPQLGYGLRKSWIQTHNWAKTKKKLDSNQSTKIETNYSNLKRLGLIRFFISISLVFFIYIMIISVRFIFYSKKLTKLTLFTSLKAQAKQF